MTTRELLTGLTCAALLAGCASTKVAPPPPAAPAPPSMAALIEQANAAYGAAHYPAAMALLKRAADLYPASKAPWLRIAQVNFECHEYGDAITHAQLALERDPDDMVAHSIAAVSGLRVSSKALADLTARTRISADVRSEAQSLAAILRTSIGGDIIVPVTAAATGPTLK